MNLVENTLIVLAAILFFGLLIPEFFKKFQLPFVTSLIVIGSLLGPNGLAYFKINEGIELFGFLGSAFLMLLAGLEVKRIRFQEYKNKILMMVAANTIVPFAIGFSLVKGFGYTFSSAVLIGIIFTSSSIVLVISTMRSTRLSNSELGKVITAVVVIEDILGLLLLTIYLQTLDPTTIFPPLIYLGMLISSIILMRMFLPEIATYYLRKHRKTDDEYEKQLRFIIALLFATLIFFSWIGVHPIVGSFIVGVLIADVLKSEALYRKIHTLGYGLFVPIFFFVLGMEIDLKILSTINLSNYLMISIIFGLIFSKLISGFLAGRYVGFSQKESLIFGISSTSKLTTTLSATYAAITLGVLDTTLATSIVILSVITTLLAPTMLNFVQKRWRNHA